MLKIQVSTQTFEERIDVFLANNTEYSRNAIQKLIENNRVLVNGINVNKKYLPKYGDSIEIIPFDPIPLEVKASNIDLNIKYEDDDILVVDKPIGMVVHPAPGNYEDTLVNALVSHCGDSLSGINGVMRPGIIHRIDKDTSGLLIVAKNDKSHVFLADQIKDHLVSREYLAVVHGKFRSQTGTINAPIGRNKKDRKKMAVTCVNSKNAITHYDVLEEFDKYSLIKCKLETGRTHQIRVHMSSAGHPIVGDQLYGIKTTLPINHQCLHAYKISFVHPTTKEKMTIESELPLYFNEILHILREENAYGQ